VFSAGSPEKMAAMDQANKPLFDLVRQRKVREMWTLEGQCTPQRARQYGVDYQAWRDSLNKAMDADYLAMAATGKRLAEMLEKAESIRITASGGTDLSMHLARRPVSINDGIIDDSDLARGIRFSSFPDGNISLAPDEHSANGTIVFSPLQLWGKNIRDLRWVFKDGRLIDWSAAENGQVFEEYYTAATGDKDRFGFLAIGINPQAKPIGFTFLDWLAVGTVTGGIGYNLDDGGSNDSSYGQSGIVIHANLTVDGKSLLKDGKLLV
jgi:leucyl aminopeptidase (aminopeptidase T)